MRREPRRPIDLNVKSANGGSRFVGVVLINLIFLAAKSS